MGQEKTGDPDARGGGQTRDRPTGADLGAERGNELPELLPVIRRGFKSALARWAIRRRARPGPGTADQHPRARDEATHPWDGRRHFAESYSFACVQPELAVIARLEWLPGRGAQRVWLVVLRPDGAHGIPGSRGESSLIRTSSPDRWRAGGLRLDCVAPHKTWTVRFSGRLDPLDGGADDRCGVDLTFLGTATPFVPGTDDDPDLIARQLGAATWDARLLRLLRRRQSRSYVQVGAMHGSVVLGDRMLAVRGTALREHSWGVRDWAASDSALQCLSVLDDGGCAWIHRAKFPWVTLEGGFIHREGLNVPVQGLGITQDRVLESAPMHATLTVDHPGGQLGLEAEFVRSHAIRVDGRGRVELSLVRFGGDAPGWGIWAGQRRVLPRPRGAG